MVKVKYLRFDEKSNTYDSLEKLLLFLNNIKKDLNFWKWATIALHSCLYGAMVLSLRGTNPARVIQIDKALQDKLKKLYGIEKLDLNSTKHIKRVWQHGKLISFWEAFRRIQLKKYVKFYVTSKTFIPNSNHLEAMAWINDELRNPFLHFVPRSWSNDVSKLKKIFSDCLEVIEFCLFQSGNIFPPDDEDEEKKLFLGVIKKIKLTL